MAWGLSTIRSEDTYKYALLREKIHVFAFLDGKGPYHCDRPFVKPIRSVMSLMLGRTIRTDLKLLYKQVTRSVVACLSVT